MYDGRVTLPYNRGVGWDGEHMASGEHKRASGAPERRALRVLVVEDNEANQVLAAGLLKRCGHDAVVVRTGSSAVAAWEHGGFDLILMDLQMPEMDGFEATRAIRRKETGTGARTPIVALTANAASTDEARCRAAGMDAFMSKPVSFDALCEILARASALEIAAHKLKGSVAMFGAQAARGAAQRLEDLAEVGDFTSAGDARRDLGTEIARLQAALEAVDAEGVR